MGIGKFAVLRASEGRNSFEIDVFEMGSWEIGGFWDGRRVSNLESKIEVREFEDEEKDFWVVEDCSREEEICRDFLKALIF